MKQTLTAFAAALLVVLFSGCNIETNFDEKTEGYESYPLSAGYTLLEIDNKAGNVIVTASDKDSVCIDYTQKAVGTTSSIFSHDHSKDINVEFETNPDDGSIKIVTDFPESPTINYSVDFEIQVPETMELDILNALGNVEATGLALKPKRLAAASGNMTLKDFKCGARAQTAFGNIDCEISDLPSGQSVDLSASAGNIALEVSAMDTTNSIDISGDSGNVDVTLPAAVELSFDMSVTAGTVGVNGFTPEQGSPWTNTHKVGTLGTNAAKSTLTVTVGAGNVILNKGD